MDNQQMSANTKLVLRFAEPTDCDALFELVKALAEYEKLSHAVTGNASLLKNTCLERQNT